MMETNQPTKKDSGMETKPGEESGKMAQSAPGNMEVSEPETAGEKKMSTGRTPRRCTWRPPRPRC